MDTWNHLDIGEAIAALNAAGHSKLADAVAALLAERDQRTDLLDRIARNAAATAAEFEATGAKTHAQLMRAVVLQANAFEE